MAKRFEHCRLIGNEIEYMGRVGVFSDKRDTSWGSKRAWDHLEKEGWELVSVVVDAEGRHVAYFKRQAGE
jgi:hypothetical protein